MLFWWLTASVSFRPLLNVMTRLVYSSTFLYMGYDNRHFKDMGSDMMESKGQYSSDLIEGIYDYESSSNFNNYLKELGVSYLLRTFAGMASPVVSISNSCNETHKDKYSCQWNIRTDTLFKSHEVNFRLGKWGEDVTMDDRRVKFKFDITGDNELEEIQVNLDKVDPSVAKETRLVRTFSEDKMTVKLSANDVTSSSVFLRQFSRGRNGDWD